MSDQVEIMAAEDAPGNNEGGEAVSPTQATSEQPEATTVESDSESAPAADPVAETPMLEASSAEEVTAEEVTVEEAEESSATDVVATEASEPDADATSADAPAAEEAEETQLVDGPVGEVLDEPDQTVAEQAEPDVQADRGAAAEEQDADGDKSNVRILSVGQQVSGTVKRIADFGAFVDIGVGRDGLIHISELSVRRVGKVTDVLTEGQEVTAWIKKLDRDRNRISLTLIDPNTKTIRDLNKDDLVQGTVTRILPYGAFIDIGIGRDALLHVREMGVGYVAKPEDVVKVGDTLEARIIELSRRRGRVDLSLKGLRDEPEPTPAASQQQWVAPQSQPQAPRSPQQAEPEPEVEDDFEDLEVLSPMELAFKRAMEAEGMELNVSRKKQGKRGRHERNRSLQDEIISRTLSSSGRK